MSDCLIPHQKVEHKCCAMACANDMLETLYGTNDNYDWTQHNMPQNKYKRAALTLKVKHHKYIFSISNNTFY